MHKCRSSRHLQTDKQLTTKRTLYSKRAIKNKQDYRVFSKARRHDTVRGIAKHRCETIRRDDGVGRRDDGVGSSSRQSVVTTVNINLTLIWLPATDRPVTATDTTKTPHSMYCCFTEFTHLLTRTQEAHGLWRSAGWTAIQERWPTNSVNWVGLTYRVFSIVAFKTFDISQSNVGKHLMYGGIFSDSIITNFLLILTAKWFWKLVNIW